MSREYKNCGISWIGDLPATWATRRVKDVAKYVNGYPFAPEHWSDHGVPIVRIQNLTSDEAMLNRTTIQVPPKNHIDSGDILISWPASLGAYLWRFGHAYLNQHIFKCFPRENVTRTFFFWLANAFIDEMRNDAHGSTMHHIQIGPFKNTVVPIPSIDEQHRIAGWLDVQTNRIDKRRELLGEKRELLRDLKKSIVEETTFRGIAASMEMRDSGIDWLGHVPAHWTTMRLGSLFREAADSGIDGLPMLSVSLRTGISDKELDDEEMERKVSRSEDRTLYKRVKPGDLVYNQMRAWQGAFGAARIEGLVSPAYVVARPGRAVVPRFVEYLLRAPAAMEEIRRRSRGITDFRLRLYWDEFKNIRIALPPNSEQEEIATFLDRKLSQIDRQIALIDQLDDLLQQQRKAIIHEAVTGKIDLTGEPVVQSAAMLEES